jgi:hypothetical protein
MGKMSLINSNLLFLLICLILSKFTFVYSEASILEFASYHYRAGHFAFDSNGNMVIEYSRDNHRLFFGLKKMEMSFLKMMTTTYHQPKNFILEIMQILVSDTNQKIGLL